jgi:prephenate dehydrogenase
MRLADAIVTIVGMGLMGGSLGMALVKGRACKEVRALTRRSSSAEEIVKAKAADKAGTNPEKLLSDADLIVFAAPVRTIRRQIGTLHAFMKPGAVVTEMGSTKGGIVEALDRLPAKISAVGGHPMCGKEVSGLDAADPDLFRDRVWVLTPLDRTPSRAMALVGEMVEVVGARPVIMAAQTHDTIVACISHLPYMLATTLVSVAEEVSAELPAVWTLASSGFRDTSRVAASDVTMMMDILAVNNDRVRTMLIQARDRIQEFIDLLESEDFGTIGRELQVTRARRLGMFQSNEGKTVNG